MSTDHTCVKIHESFSNSFDILAKEGVSEAGRQIDKLLNNSKSGHFLNFKFTFSK